MLQCFYGKCNWFVCVYVCLYFMILLSLSNSSMFFVKKNLLWIAWVGLHNYECLWIFFYCLSLYLLCLLLVYVAAGTSHHNEQEWWECILIVLPILGDKLSKFYFQVALTRDFGKMLFVNLDNAFIFLTYFFYFIISRSYMSLQMFYHYRIFRYF